MNEPLSERVVRIVETVYSLPQGVVTPGSSTEEIEQWDSLGHLVLMLELEQEFGLKLGPAEIQQMTSVPAIVATLAARLG